MLKRRIGSVFFWVLGMIFCLGVQAEGPTGAAPQLPKLVLQAKTGTASQRIHLLENAYLLVPISNVTIEQPGNGLGSMTIDRTDEFDPMAVYTPPASPNALAGQSKTFTLRYTVTDRASRQGQGSITVTLQPGGDLRTPMAPNEGIAAMTPPCSEARGSQCRELAFGKSLINLDIRRSAPHVWRFVFPTDNQRRQISWFEGRAKRGTVAELPGQFVEENTGCSKQAGGATINLVPRDRAAANECGLIPGQVYYFNIRTDQDRDGYDLVTY